MFLLLFCSYFRTTMSTLISSGRVLSLEDETDKTSDNLNLDNVRSTIGDKKLSSSLTLLQNSDRLKETYSILNTTNSRSAASNPFFAVQNLCT